MRNPAKLSLTLLAAIAALSSIAIAQTAGPVDPRMYAGLTWRNLGPFRAGRVAAVTGAIGQPGVFYIGLPGAGVWKTTSAGQVWYPVFDSVKEISSIGSVEVAPSDASVVYAGAGDIITGGSINEGNGVYRSRDAGRTWQHVGLEATKQIPSMLVGVSDPNLVLVAAQGDVHHKGRDRGVFRSTDGGATWAQTLFVDDSTGAQKLARAFDTPQVIFATTVLHYTPPVPAGRGGGPGAGGAQASRLTSSRIFKSTDGGVTWVDLTPKFLTRADGKMWVAVANHTNGQRVYVIGDFGLARSDDGGETWRWMAANDPRIRNGQGGYNCGVYVDPQNPDVVYTLNTSSYVSHDGGATFTGFRGAPGGDDPQQLWIDPTDGKRMLFGFDQGAIVSLDGGGTWSSWYNQSTEQIYHLATDNSFPYWVYGTQQDAGAIRTRIRGNLGAITPLDWNPVSGWEWGTIVPDPLDNNTVYASGSGILKISYPAETWVNVSPSQDPAAQLRVTNDQPIRFAPWNKKMLIAGFQSVWTTIDGGEHWSRISPDLAARTDQPTGAGGAPNGAIQSMSPSTLGRGLLWVGTNTGRIWVTRNEGKSWDEVSIPNLPYAARAEVFAVDASHFDPAEAYAVIDLHRTGDYTPYVYRTRDYGKTWTKITDGLPVNQPGGSFARVVRNDTKRKGLLFAGTESGMHVSFDDGDHWQSLTLDAPTSSYRDITIKDNDLIVSTYGRGFWVIDDISVLRQVAVSSTAEAAHLFKPGEAYRVRRNVGADTPFPPEVPHALNPSEGAIIDYWLAQAPTAHITLDVLDSAGGLVRHMSSMRQPLIAEAARPPHPNFWVAPPFALPRNAGENRTNWDLRYDAPHSLTHSYEINANPGLTPASPLGPVVLPGTYTLKLTVDGRSFTQTVNVFADPRTTATPAALRAQHALQMKIVQGIEASYEARSIAAALGESVRGDSTADATAFYASLDTVAGLDAQRGRGRGAGRPPAPTFSAINNALVNQLNAQENGDIAPTTAALAAFASTCKELQSVAVTWQRVITTGLSSYNAVLKQRGRTVLATPAGTLKLPNCG